MLYLGRKLVNRTDLFSCRDGKPWLARLEENAVPSGKDVAFVPNPIDSVPKSHYNWSTTISNDSHSEQEANP